MQSRWGSFFEACINTAIGFLITMVFLPIVNRICGIEMTIGQASLSTAFFTAISVARSYVIRRLFNGNIGWTIINKIKNEYNKRAGKKVA